MPLGDAGLSVCTWVAWLRWNSWWEEGWKVGYFASKYILMHLMLPLTARAKSITTETQMTIAEEIIWLGDQQICRCAQCWPEDSLGKDNPANLAAAKKYTVFRFFIQMRLQTWNFRTTIYGVRSNAFLTSLSAHCALEHWSTRALNHNVKSTC